MKLIGYGSLLALGAVALGPVSVGVVAGMIASRSPKPHYTSPMGWAILLVPGIGVPLFAGVVAYEITREALG